MSTWKSWTLRYKWTQRRKDLLTAFDGQSITYDGAGNPTSYYDGSTMTWSEGRRLASLSGNGKSYTYSYDLNGIRTKKVSSDGSSRKYYIVDGKAVGETVYKANGSFAYNLRYTFDEKGDVCGVSYWGPGATAWTKYYFTKNLQGDVTAVYRVEAANDQIAGFTKVASYTYDSWGNVLSQSGEFAEINPFRYRGYYYDTETGFYYLQSRYYDPAIGRFVNADAFTSTGQGFLGYNMFAYCGNDPICYIDPSGDSFAIVLGFNFNFFGWGLTASVNLVSTKEDFGVQYSYYIHDDAEIQKKENQTIGIDIGPYVGVQYTDKTKMEDLTGLAKATGGDLFLGADILTDKDSKYLGWQFGASAISFNQHSYYTNTQTCLSFPAIKWQQIIQSWVFKEY